MVKKSSHLHNYQAIAHSNGSHQLHFSIQTAEVLKKVLQEIIPPEDKDKDTHATLEALIRKELTQTLVHKKNGNHNVSEKSVSKIRWEETEKVNKIFTILYQDYNHPLMTPQIKKIWDIIAQYTQWKELEQYHTLPRLLQDSNNYTPQSLHDILATVRRIKKQRSLLSAIKTKKIDLKKLLPYKIVTNTTRLSEPPITRLSEIQGKKSYKCNIFSDFSKNKTANRLLQALGDMITSALPGFEKTDNMHVTWQFYDKTKGSNIINKHGILEGYMKSYTAPIDELHNHTFHKAHVWTSNVNQKRYLLLTPHEDNTFTNMVAHGFTPHISLGIYEGHLSDEDILGVLKNCKDQLFTYNNTNLFHITPDQILKIKCTERIQ